VFYSHAVVNCTDPGIPANSIRESKIEHGNFTLGSVVFYTCNPGYYLFGSSALTCQPIGHWDKPLPECLGTLSVFSSQLVETTDVGSLFDHCFVAEEMQMSFVIFFFLHTNSLKTCSVTRLY
jgi:hypothetical protein